MRRRTVTARTGERLVRAAYDFEALASRMAAEGWSHDAEAVRAAARHLGNAARNLLDEFDRRQARGAP